MNPALNMEVKGLKRHFGRVRAVDGVSFAVQSGQIMGFIGPNGAGKTTTLRIIATLDEPTAGDVWIDGVSVREFPEAARRRVGYVPDSLPEHGDMTVHEYLDFFARAYGLNKSARLDAVQEIKEFTRLTNLEDKLLRSLSKGMKQRVSLARALVHDPGILIMDEPTAGLDPRARIEFRELITILAEQGKALLISSHILSELTEVCNAVLIIEHGRILDSGALDEVATRNNTRQMAMIRSLGAADALQATLLELPGVVHARRTGGQVEVEIQGGEAELSEVLSAAIGRGHRIVEFRLLNRDLEDVFLRVTKGDVK